MVLHHAGESKQRHVILVSACKNRAFQTTCGSDGNQLRHPIRKMRLCRRRYGAPEKSLDLGVLCKYKNLAVAHVFCRNASAGKAQNGSDPESETIETHLAMWNG